MNHSDKICCLCLNKSNSSLLNLFSKGSGDESSSYFDKISSSLSQLAQIITELCCDCLICSECSNTIEMIYKFNHTCLDNVKIYSKSQEKLKDKEEEVIGNNMIIVPEEQWVKEKEENISSVVDYCQIKMEIEETKDEAEDQGQINLIDSTDNTPDESELEVNKEKSCTSDEPLKSEIYLEDLKVLHTSVDRFTCNICGQSYKQRGNLTAHMHLHTQEGQIKKNEKKGSFMCITCGKLFNQKIHLINHSRIHTGEKPHACDVCGKRFRYVNGLSYHKLVHSNERTIACDKCDKTFRCKKDLNSHLGNVHTEEKKHVCELCNKAFKQKGDLITHIRRHTGEKPYACSLCDKKFITQSKVAFHIKTAHVAVKPYACDLCDKSFLTNKQLVEHNSTHTGEKHYLCDICSKSFHKEQSLKRHKKIHI